MICDETRVTHPEVVLEETSFSSNDVSLGAIKICSVVASINNRTYTLSNLSLPPDQAWIFNQIYTLSILEAIRNQATDTWIIVGIGLPNIMLNT